MTSFLLPLKTRYWILFFTICTSMKVLFITWWVLSGIGKWITAASIGALLKWAGLKVFCQKFDGYLNVDPWTMSPFQHGEVFVTEDGTETDLDIGHYERFLDTNLNKYASFTSWKLYEEIIFKERRGDYLWGTVQIVPHLTNLVKEKIRLWYDSAWADITIIEIGGTVGDMENEYILESARQLRNELWEDNVRFIHIALLPYLLASKELKSKPIQHSIRTLMSYGINPDFLIVRADNPIPEEIIEKISLNIGMKLENIIWAPTLDTIYRVPMIFHNEHFGEKILQCFKLKNEKPDMREWEIFLNNIDSSFEIIKIGMVGKYTELEDAYYSLNEWLKCAGFVFQKKVELHFIEAEDIEKNGIHILEEMDGICIPGGFWNRWIEGMIQTTKYARDNKIPFLWICLGSQIMAIEFARNVLGLSDASSEEFTPDGSNNVIHIMEHQKNLTSKWGNMRLGSYLCNIHPKTLAEKLYTNSDWPIIKTNSSITISERHRHRFEFNPSYRVKMEEAGFIVSASSPDGMLAEIVEIKNHPYMIATQSHPELISRPNRPHPLFRGFIQAIIKNRIL